MSVLRGILFLSILGLVTVLAGGTTLAKDVSVNGGQLEVKARILPAHTVVIDEQGDIIQIASNTAGDVAKPRVFLLSVATANEQPVTQALYDQYRRHVPAGESRIGILYERPPVITMLETPSVSSAISMLKTDHALALQ